MGDGEHLDIPINKRYNLRDMNAPTTPPRILAIAQTMNVGSGWGRYAHDVATGLDRLGFFCRVITWRKTEPGDVPLSSELAELVPSLHPVMFMQNIVRIRTHVISDGITVVHAFDCWPFAVMAWLALLGLRVPLFISGIGTYSIPPERRSLKRWLMQQAYRRAKEVFCISRYTRDQIAQRTRGAQLKVIPLGTTELPILTSQERMQLSNFFQIDPAAYPVILTVGHVKHRKGQLETLKAVCRLKEQYPSILYVTLGSQADTEYVQRMKTYAKEQGIENHLRMVTDHKGFQGLSALYQRADVFAMNSNNHGDHYEGFGLVFLEAAQFGVPALGSQDCGIEDAIKDGVTGRLTRQGDVEDIVEKMRDVIMHRSAYGAAAKEFSRGFRWERTVQAYVSAYKQADEAVITEFTTESSWQVPKYDVHALRKKRSDYCVCIPVLNENANIRKQLERMRPFAGLVDVIIADGGSTDGTRDFELFAREDIRSLLTLGERGRQGTQLRMAFSYALREGYKGILQIDGNNKDGVEAIPQFIQALEEGFDYVQGSRFIPGGKPVNTPPVRWIGVRLLASPILSLGAGYWYTDVTNGFRGYSRRYLLHPGVQPFRSVFVQYEFNMYLTVRANQLGLKTKEIPVARVYPKGKVPTKISFFRGNSDFFKAIVKAALGGYNPR